MWIFKVLNDRLARMPHKVKHGNTKDPQPDYLFETNATRVANMGDAV